MCSSFPTDLILEMTAWRRLCSTPIMREIAVHDVSQVRAALAAAEAAGVPVQLRSAPGAAAYAGVGYLQALGEAVGHDLLIDCGEDAGLVMAALRTGCRKLAFSGAGELFERLKDMAEQVGAALRYEPERPPVLDLAPEDDAHSVCLAWLSDLIAPDVTAPSPRPGTSRQGHQ